MLTLAWRSSQSLREVSPANFAAVRHVCNRSAKSKRHRREGSSAATQEADTTRVLNCSDHGCLRCFQQLLAANFVHGLGLQVGCDGPASRTLMRFATNPPQQPPPSEDSTLQPHIDHVIDGRQALAMYSCTMGCEPPRRELQRTRSWQV